MGLADAGQLNIRVTYGLAVYSLSQYESRLGLCTYMPLQRQEAYIHVEVYQGGIDSMQEAIRLNKNPSSSYRGLTWSRGNSRGISLRIWSLLTTTPKLPSSNVSNHATAESLDLKPSYLVKFNYLGILSRVVHVSLKKRHRFEIPREEF